MSALGRQSTAPSRSSTILGGNQKSYLSAARNQLNLSPTGSVASTATARGRGGPPMSPAMKRRQQQELEAAREAEHETNITVVVRCRGRSEREVKENSGVIVSTPGGLRGREVALQLGPHALNNKLYTFDRVFPPEADQSIIYDDVVHPMLTEVLISTAVRNLEELLLMFQSRELDVIWL